MAEQTPWGPTGQAVATPALTKSTTIMVFMWLVDDKAKFTYGDDSNPSYFSMSAEAWEDMGQPRTITVTVEPGDLLNEA